MVTTVRPKASATPTRPMPTSGNLAASTALPQPPKTSQKVPNNSATARLAMGMMVLSPLVLLLEESTPAPPGAHHQLAGTDGNKDLRSGALDQQRGGLARLELGGDVAQVLHVVHAAIVH